MIQIGIPDDDLVLVADWAVKQAARRPKGKKGDTWTKVPPWAPLHDGRKHTDDEWTQYVGKLTEVCFACWVNELESAEDACPDYRFLEGGDDGIDFVLSDRKIDVKGCHSLNAPNLLVPATKKGKPVSIKADIYVLCCINSMVYCDVWGWASAAQLGARPLVQGRKVYSNHKNREVTRNKLFPMSALARILNRRI